MTEARLPASWVAAGHGVPGVCARHGEPATQLRRMQLVSRPRRWTYALLLAGALPFLIAVMVLRTQVVAPAWPFCARCASLRTSRLLTGLGVLGVALVVFVLAIALSAPGREAAVALLVLLSAVLVIAGIVFATRSAPPLVAGAVVSQDGRWVVVRKADGRFAAEAGAALAAASGPAGH